MNIAERIDHTVLKADATKETVIRYCKEAKEYGFASVCVNTGHTALVASELKGSNVKTCCVVGFPLGAMLTSAKAFEAAEAVKAGAQEVDMVINVGAVKDKDWDFVREDIRAVVEASKPAIVTVIIGAAFVKTSTGFSTGGATVEDIRLMKETVGDRLEVKASGGIRTREFTEALIEAGADRIGAGNGVILL